jgi:hypothetical protein
MGNALMLNENGGKCMDLFPTVFNPPLYQPIKFHETKNWSFAIWKVCIKKIIHLPILSFGPMNYMFHKLFADNTKHVKLKLWMSPW